MGTDLVLVDNALDELLFVGGFAHEHDGGVDGSAEVVDDYLDLVPIGSPSPSSQGPERKFY